MKNDSDSAEREHCENAVGELADREGLVVITSAVVELLMRERADAVKKLVVYSEQLEARLKEANAIVRAAVKFNELATNYFADSGCDDDACWDSDDAFREAVLKSKPALDGQ